MKTNRRVNHTVMETLRKCNQVMLLSRGRDGKETARHNETSSLLIRLKSPSLKLTVKFTSGETHCLCLKKTAQNIRISQEKYKVPVLTFRCCVLWLTFNNPSSNIILCWWSTYKVGFWTHSLMYELLLFDWNSSEIFKHPRPQFNNNITV